MNIISCYFLLTVLLTDVTVLNVNRNNFAFFFLQNTIFFILNDEGSFLDVR